MTADQLATTLERLRRMRHAKAMTAPKPDPDGSLVPLLEVSAEVCALDNAISLLERELKASPAAAAADALGRTSRELAEAIALLPKMTSQFDRELQLSRIERLRTARDAAMAAFRAATGGESAC